MSSTKRLAFTLWSREEVALFAFLFCFSLGSKGIGLAQGFSLDDFFFAGTPIGEVRDAYFAQGRHATWILLSSIEAIGVSPVDCGLVFGIAGIAMQAAFAVYAIRFVGLLSFSASLICGGIITLHPYTVEIYTYKIALPIVSIFFFLIIAAIETARQKDFAPPALALVSAYILASLFIYQLSFNYILAVALSGILAGLLCRPSDLKRSNRTISASLLLLMGLFMSSGVYLMLLKVLGLFGFGGQSTARSNILNVSELPVRIGQILDSLGRQYLYSEPIARLPVKIILVLIISLAMALIAIRLFTIYGFILSCLMFGLILLCWSIASIGITVLFQDWYPAPRVFSHYSTLIGLTLMTCFNYALPANRSKLFRRTIYIVGGILVGCYALVGNQILVDQLRINKWDTLLANRIIGRLEVLPGYKNVTSIELQEAAFPYKHVLKTSHMDINQSAFSKEWSKASLFREATGDEFSTMGLSRGSPPVCKAYWPAIDAIYIIGSKAIVCLP